MATRKSLQKDKPRHSHNFEHGPPRKGGAGSKTVWGDYKQDIRFANEKLVALDPHDPNFSTDEDNASIVSIDLREFQDPRKPRGKYDELVGFRNDLKGIIRELYIDSDVEKATRNISKMVGGHQFGLEICKLVVSTSLDRDHNARVVAEELLNALIEKEIVSKGSIVIGLSTLINRLDDLVLDVPEARAFLKEFIRLGELRGYIEFSTAELLYKASDIYEDPDRTKGIKNTIRFIIDEFLTNHDFEEAYQSIAALNAPEFHHEIIKQAISMACDRTNKERELISELIADFTGDVLNAMEVEKGFEKLLFLAEELYSDIPSICTFLSCFLARAVIDEALPPAFLERVKFSESNLAFMITETARNLLSRKHAAVRLSRVWGFSDSDTVADLKNDIRQLLNEYFASHDIEEAIRCIQDLGASQFHHEVIYQTFSITADKPKEDWKVAKTLYHHLFLKNIVHASQFSKGFRRIHSGLDELSIDAPLANQMANDFTEVAKAEGYLSKEFYSS